LPTKFNGLGIITVKNWILVLALTLSSSAWAAQEVYVSDELSIFVRSGPTREYRIINALKSGTKLKLIDQNKETGYSKVATDTGKTGWVLTKEIQAEPVARMLLSNARGDKKKMEEQREETLSKLRNALNRIDELQANNTKLNSEVIKLERELNSVTTQNMQLKSRSNKDLFILGAGLMFIGVVVGAIVRRAKPPRRRDAW
tara:strand:- start:251 stop:853 length:603 start_codon:yes stop_codon:yes gene_type:complete